MTAESPWSEARIQLLAGLWREGMSTAEIGRRLGISKNAVVGKAHRLALPSRPSPIKNRSPRPAMPQQPRLRRQPEPAKPQPAKLVAVQPGTGAPCQWPHGHPGQPGFHFCGQASVAGKPYCSEHAARAYVSAKSRNEAAA